MASSDHVDRTVLVTGGCGYIGTHTIVCLLEQNYNVVVVDNLVNSSQVSLDRVCEIIGLTGKDRESRLRFYEVDICNENDLRQVFLEQKQRGNPFFSCIHFAGLKVAYREYHLDLSDYVLNFYTSRHCSDLSFQAVGESTRIPIRYYENNLIGTFVLLRLLDEFECHSLVFSSSATGKSSEKIYIHFGPTNLV